MDKPETTIESLAELVAFALIAERRAHERYAADSRVLEHGGNQRLALVFRRLAEEERKHVDELESFAEHNGLVLDLDVAARRFADVGDSASREHPQADRTPDAATPYGVLARAVRGEERAFEFYCQLAASATDPQMREFAEVFAAEELAHAALLRAQRRDAYRTEQARSAGELPDPERIASLDDLLECALLLERRLAARLDDGPRALADACRDVLADLEVQLDQIGGAPRGGPTPQQASLDESDATGTVESLTALRDELDRLFSFYDRVVQTTQIEPVARAAQSLMAATLDRIHLAERINPSPPD